MAAFLKLASLAAILLVIGSEVNALDNKLALTPPMGWLTWEHFTCRTDCKKYPQQCVSDKLIRQIADSMDQSYVSAGYKYINIDDCWSTMERDPETKRLVPHPERFGGEAGMRALSDYVHRKGLLLGTYGDCGTKTCAGYPAQLKTEDDYEDNYFDVDAETLADWGIDSFKFDGCNIEPFKAESICPKMAKVIESKKRPTLLICEWPFYMLRLNPLASVNWTLAMESCNVVRYYEDVEDSWQSIINIVDFTVKLQDTIKIHHGPGHWFDPDQLVIGNFGLSLDQARAQMALWSVWAAPLYMGNDLRKIEHEMALILTNKNLIKVNQDPLGVFGLMVGEKKGLTNQKIQAFVKPVLPIRNGCPSFAVVYLNRATLGTSELVSFDVRDLLIKSAIDVAAERYNKMYDLDTRPGGEFSAKRCIERLSRGMKSAKKPKEAGQSSTSDQANQPIYWDVHDLIFRNYLRDAALDSSLDLEVNPSGVRAVLLTEEEK